MGVGKLHVYPLVLLGVVVLALAGPVAGGGKVAFAGGGDAAAVLQRVMSTRLEDSVAPELAVDLDLHRRVLAGAGGLGPSVFKPDRPACSPNCAGRGRPYTNHGCLKTYRCPS